MPKALTQRTLLLTGLAMLAFAGNSLLCRLALKDTPIDAVSFTSLRLIAGAVMLWLLLRWRNRTLVWQRLQCVCVIGTKAVHT